jgi:hypothetical protein
MLHITILSLNLHLKKIKLLSLVCIHGTKLWNGEMLLSFLSNKEYLVVRGGSPILMPLGFMALLSPGTREEKQGNLF